MEQRITGTCKIWQEPFVVLRVRCIFSLRMDPYERALVTSNTFLDRMFRHVFLLVPAQAIFGECTDAAGGVRAPLPQGAIARRIEPRHS